MIDGQIGWDNTQRSLSISLSKNEMHMDEGKTENECKVISDDTQVSLTSSFYVILIYRSTFI